jgi:hypothetical protein
VGRIASAPYTRKNGVNLVALLGVDHRALRTIDKEERGESGGTPEKSHSAYPCEVAGGSSLAEPWDDSSSAEAL